MKALKIKTDFTSEVVEITAEPLYMAMAGEIGCEFVEYCKLHWLPEAGHLAIVCDDEFLLKGKPVLNINASILYGAGEHGQPLCGDCLIVREKHTPDGIETVSLTDDDIQMIYDALPATLMHE